MFAVTFEHNLPYQFNCLEIKAMAFWLRPRNQAGGPRWLKNPMRCKSPVLERVHLYKKAFLSIYYKNEVDFLNNDKENNQTRRS